MRLLFATNNRHKLEEVREILPPTCEVISLSDAGFSGDIPETGETLNENSRQKAETICQWLKANGQWPQIDGVIADDTGLEVKGLNGQPGVYSARYAGEPANDTANRAKLLREMAGMTDREARFRTVVTLIRGEKEEQYEGIVCGRIETAERGENGFGYDRLFVPQEEDDNGRGRTFAQMTDEEKNHISHRSIAFRQLTIDN